MTFPSGFISYQSSPISVAFLVLFSPPQCSLPEATRIPVVPSGHMCPGPLNSSPGVLGSSGPRRDHRLSRRPRRAPGALSALPPAPGTWLLPTRHCSPARCCRSSLDRPVFSEDCGLKACRHPLASGILLLHVALWGASFQPSMPRGEIQKLLCLQPVRPSVRPSEVLHSEGSCTPAAISSPASVPAALPHGAPVFLRVQVAQAAVFQLC